MALATTVGGDQTCAPPFLTANGKTFNLAVKNLFAKLKDEMTASGELSDEKVAALSQLEQIIARNLPPINLAINGTSSSISAAPLEIDATDIRRSRSPVKSSPCSPCTFGRSQRSRCFSNTSASAAFPSTSQLISQGRASKDQAATEALAFNNVSSALGGANFDGRFSDRTRRMIRLLDEPDRTMSKSKRKIKPPNSISFAANASRSAARRCSEDSSSVCSFATTRCVGDASQKRDVIKRRHSALNRRHNFLASAEVVDFQASNLHDLATECQVMYDDLLVRKTPFEAYYAITASLRKFFSRETWNDTVDAVMKDFMKNHLFKSAKQLSDKYLKFSTDVPASRKIDDYQLQILLHIHAVTIDKNEKQLDHATLEKIVELMHVIPFIGDTKTLQDFLDDILNNFVDAIPRHLTFLYEELSQRPPDELRQYASEECAQTHFYEPLVVPSPAKCTYSNPVKFRGKTSLADDDGDDDAASTFSSASQPSRNNKRTQSFFGNKHHRMITMPGSASKRMKLGNRKRISQNCSHNFNAADSKEHAKKVRTPMRRSSCPAIKRTKKLARTPKGKGVYDKNNSAKSLVPETPTFHQIRESEKRRRKSINLAKEHKNRLIVNETPPRFWSKLPGIIVRQSPRQHASTRALYSSAPRLISRLAQKAPNAQKVDDDDSDDDSLEHLAPSTGFGSPAFVHLKLASGDKSSTKSKSGRAAFFLQSPDKTPATSSKMSGFFGDFVPATETKPRKSASPCKKFRKNLSQTFSNDESSMSNFPFAGISTSLSDSPAKKPCLNLQQSTAFSPLRQKLNAADLQSPSRTSKIVNFAGIMSPLPKCKTPSPNAKNNFSKSSPVAKNCPNSVAKNCSNSIATTTASCKRNAGTSLSAPNIKSGVKPVSSTFCWYNIPDFACQNYADFMNDLKREKAKPGDDLFYARDSVRRSVFCNNVSPAHSVSQASPVSKQRRRVDLPPRPVAPKNRIGRKALSSCNNSVHIIHSANFLLNAQNKNLENLRKNLPTPLKLNKKLRAVPKNARRRRRHVTATSAPSSS